MLQPHFGNIVIYNEQQNLLTDFENLLNNRMLTTFGTNNIYQFVKYSRELFPDVMILNLESSDASMLEEFHSWITYENKQSYPIIVLMQNNRKINVNPHIAHYLILPIDAAKLAYIVESYCLGHKHHQIMLLSSYSDEYDKLHQSLDYGQYNYFEVHTYNLYSFICLYC